jgi:hypothetical protein
VGPKVGLDAVAKRKIPFLCREPNPGSPARILVVILTELPRLFILINESIYVYLFLRKNSSHIRSKLLWNTVWGGGP